MTTIATICARGGSKRVPRKNLRPLLGKPLICHTIEQAIRASSVQFVYVSTDDVEIAELARATGAEVPFLRPGDLASDDAGKLPSIVHLVEFVETQGVAVDRIVDLDPTSPLRSLEDIEACIRLLDSNTDVVITGYPAEKNPYFNMVEIDQSGNCLLSKKPPAPILRGQDAPAVYSMNASIYVWHRSTLHRGLWEGRTKLHVMPRERSIDIDTEIDFRIVEFLMRQTSTGEE